MTSAERIERIEALQRQLAELRAGVVQLQGEADDMYRRLRNLEVEVLEMVKESVRAADGGKSQKQAKGTHGCLNGDNNA